MSAASRRQAPAAAVQRAAAADPEVHAPLPLDSATKLADAAVDAAPATQVRKPWRATVRTAVQVAVGLAPMLPAIVDAAGVDDTAAPVAGALAISAGVARVMALPGVEAFLQRFVPWLAASPRPQG